MLQRIRYAPTPMAALSLGIASLGRDWEAVMHSGGYLSGVCALVSLLLLSTLTLKFLMFKTSLLDDLSHPVSGSVLPTFAMSIMLIADEIAQVVGALGEGLWLLGFSLHLLFLVSFIKHRSAQFELNQLMPSWFVPPVGISIAALSCPDQSLYREIAHISLYFALYAYLILLPFVLYRLIFMEAIADIDKPALAILAAPASLVLASYLTFITSPSVIVIAVLSGIALLMTATVYVAFLQLLRMNFSANFAAFTFPSAISAAATFEVFNWMQANNIEQLYQLHVYSLAMFELMIATVIILYVTGGYAYHFLWLPLTR